MSSTAETESFRHYVVPRDNGTALIEPPVKQLRASISQWQGESGEVEFCGRALTTLRKDARRETVHAAHSFTAAYREVDTADSESPLLLSGHQPELFHAGVWFKNFLLSSLAERCDGLAINFLVDNDLCRSPSIRVPSADRSAVAKSVLYDAPRDAIPWELRRLESRGLWESFPDRVLETLSGGVQQPLLTALWKDASEAVRRSDRIGLAIAEARHRLEGRMGLRTLEVPLSYLVRGRTFALFSLQVLSELPRFQDVYNRQVQRYRRAHGIRNHAHPVPNLQQEEGWLEGPWWVYRQSAPKRQRLWVKVVDDQLVLSDRAGWQAAIEGRLDCASVAEQWLDILADGICLRPRALLTTMYLRMMVSDLFIHGIGGGKYDQLTEAITQEFFGIELSPMAVATATLHLPIASKESDLPTPAEVAERMSSQKQLQWQLRYHGERLLDESSSEVQELHRAKRRLLKNIPPRGEKWEWHRHMRDLNQRLADLAGRQIENSKRCLESLAIEQRRSRLVNSREYSFALFPQQYIGERLRQLSGLDDA